MARDRLEQTAGSEADIPGMSALLTTTIPYMKVVIDSQVDDGIHDETFVLVGGTPLNEELAISIGADAYCRDAGTPIATRVARAGSSANAFGVVGEPPTIWKLSPSESE
jgi:5-methyltetrahydrofolate--homocysteine methyltransferase